MSTRFRYVDSPYLVPFHGRFRVKDHDTRPPKKLCDDAANDAALAQLIVDMRKLQSKLMANDQRSLLLVFQAMDAAGKDGTVKAVMNGINPAGCEVYSFKKPNDIELDHDFLWRCLRVMPERGRIGIFNRSYYEEVLVVRVHPEILETQKLPDRPKNKTLWKERFESIRDMERHLARNGTQILKFWLHVGKKEQKERLLARIDDPTANWKFSGGDIGERAHWHEYMHAYEDVLNETSRPWAPWYAIPADDKRYMRRAIAQIVVDQLEAMKLHYPVVSDDARRDMLRAKRKLLAEK